MTDLDMVRYTRQELVTMASLAQEAEKRFRFGWLFVLCPVVAFFLGLFWGGFLQDTSAFYKRLGDDFLGWTGLAFVFVVLVPMVLIQRQKNKEWKERRSALLQQFEYHLSTLRATTTVNEYYWHPQVLDTLERYLTRGLASNLAECYKVLHQDQQHQALMAEMEEVRRRMRHRRYEDGWPHFPFHAGHEREHGHSHDHHHDHRR